MSLTFGSLFAGIGGFDLGFERAGLQCRWQVEIDPFCQKVLAKHWPDVTRYGDIRECGDNLERVDIICGGFPCQDISLAGKGAGLAGERSGLWREMLRLIRLLRPAYVVVENVAALLGRGINTVLGDLADSGYDAEWRCIRASDVGAPHGRNRVWIVAYTGSTRGAGLVTGANPGAIGPWGLRGAEDMRSIADAPFQRGDRRPQPLVRRMDDGLPGRMDRLRAIGNAVVPQIPEFIANQVLAFDARRNA
jgi:DNA (cytosine-5)-methyltransferase 1